MSNSKDLKLALEDFDNAIEALENENVNIDEAIKIYEEGLKKYDKCMELLENAKQTIEVHKG